MLCLDFIIPKNSRKVLFVVVQYIYGKEREADVRNLIEYKVYVGSIDFFRRMNFYGKVKKGAVRFLGTAPNYRFSGGSRLLERYGCSRTAVVAFDSCFVHGLHPEVIGSRR